MAIFLKGLLQKVIHIDIIRKSGTLYAVHKKSTIFFIAGKVTVVVKNKTKRVAFQGQLLEAIIIATLKIREETIERVLNAAMVTKVANDIGGTRMLWCGACAVASCGHRHITAGNRLACQSWFRQ
uniref:AlNc14C292G10260 protein n=1 Tax=Albugo laibachii Nc14 TaxID=890382 RepID=F0WVB6_9STRA|nr:AlNc14C292G10260 [Albugo laibachii Nc14]|eukprot:CCA25355.1 AlNc14C292G10260 [Albugo laibachii Nc14]